MFDEPSQAALWVRPARSGVRVTCGACGLHLEAHAVNGRLCVECGRAPRDTMATAIAQQQQAADTLSAAADALWAATPDDPDSALSARYGAYQTSVAASARGDEKARRRVALTNERARAGGDDPLDGLVRAWLAYAVALRSAQAAEERAARVVEVCG